MVDFFIENRKFFNASRLKNAFRLENAFGLNLSLCNSFSGIIVGVSGSDPCVANQKICMYSKGAKFSEKMRNALKRIS